VPNLALMLIVVMVPMLFLSGGWTPREAMPPAVRYLMQLSPLTHYVEVAGAVVFRGATLAELWKELAAITAIGATVLGLTTSRFRATFTAARG
jgi:ABC-2 type transport system permease protein